MENNINNMPRWALLHFAKAFLQNYPTKSSKSTSLKSQFLRDKQFTKPFSSRDNEMGAQVPWFDP